MNALLRHVSDLSGIGGVLRPGIVHRLDRGTSGLLVVAKDDATHRDLVTQFASRRVEKEYLAIVLGVPRARNGEIQAPIGRHPIHRKKMATGAPRGREARTAWQREETLDGACLLRVRIHTGRTHQIRVHLRLDWPSRGRRRHLRRHADAVVASCGGASGPPVAGTAGSARGAPRLRPPGHR